MSDYISINIQRCQPSQTIHHSNRSTYISYLVTNPNTITKYRHNLESLTKEDLQDKKVKQYFELRKTEIQQDYKSHIHQSMKANTKLYQEAVISFGRETFEQNNIADIEHSLDKFCNQFEQKYNVKILMSSLHLDEGHKNLQNEILHNYHAHILIENYSFETHKTGMRKVDFRKLQTELSQSFEHLGFRRGDPERKAVRLEHKEYRETAELIKGIDFEYQQFADINNKEFQVDTIGEFAQKIENVITENKSLRTENSLNRSQIKELEKQLAELNKTTRQNLKDSGVAIQQDYKNLKIEVTTIEEQLKNGIITELEKAKQSGFKTYAEVLERKNTSFIQKQAMKTIEKPNEISLSLINPTELPQELEHTISNLFTQNQQNQPIINTVQLDESQQITKPEEQQQTEIVNQNIQLNLANLKKIDELNDELIQKTNEITNLQAKHKKLDNNYNNLVMRKFDIEIENKNLKTLNKELSDDNFNLKIENKALSEAIERFTTLTICKGITNVTKTLVERLNSIYDHFANFKTRTQESLQIKTCDDLLDYYQKINPELVADARKTGYVTVKEHGYEPSYTSIESSPKELAEALTKATGHEVNISLVVSKSRGWSR